MRIIAGTYKGRVLKAPKNADIRPTSDKIRGAIFNALNSRGLVDGAHILDGFCGTGALGLEALSQGAQSCLFIDKNRQSLNLCKENVAALGADDRAHFLLKDTTKLPPKPGEMPAADLIFLDPPYDQNLIAPAMNHLIAQGWVSEQCVFVIETERRADTQSGSEFETLYEKIYGDTKIVFLGYTKAPE